MIRLIDANEIHFRDSDDLSLSPNDVREILDEMPTINPLQEAIDEIRKIYLPGEAEYGLIVALGTIERIRIKYAAK